MKKDSAINTAKKIFGSANIKSIDTSGASYTKKYKIAVFVPLKNVNQLTYAMAEAGAGVIGSYTLCSFRIKGTGTFKGGKASSPTVGKKGKFETVDEIRLEMICGKKNLDTVIDKMLEVHPYEEPAYEVYSVLTGRHKHAEKLAIVKLRKKTPVKNIFKKINKEIDIASLPRKIKNAKIKQGIVDLSNGNLFKPSNSKDKTLYINKNNKTINIEII